MIITILAAWTSVFASDWNLPGIDLITRAERGADETRRYAEQPAYQAMLAARENRAKELEKMKEEDFESYLEEKEKEYQRQRANDYLMERYGYDYELDEQNKFHDGHELRQTESFKKNKTKIVVHHTADNIVLTWDQDVLDYMYKTYKFHAFKRGRGDIWYNFLIDPRGKIYEWRAGGEDIIATHVAWNNSPSLGIALMGNFEEQKPTSDQIQSLTKLLVALTYKYNINPNAKTTYHRTSKSDPYLETLVDYSIIGHRDAGYTACPGEHLYNKLPAIREEVKNRLFKYELISRNSENEIMIPWFTYSSDNVHNFQIDLGIDSINSCTSSQDRIKITQCVMHDGQVNITFVKNGKASWKNSFVIKDNKGNETTLHIIFLWQEDLDPILNSVRDSYFKKHTKSNPPTQYAKITHKMTLTEAKQYLQQKIRVLLYELSKTHDNWVISCPWNCTFTLDKNVEVATTGAIKIVDDSLILMVNGKVSPWANLYVSSEDSLITVNNYDRTSYAGIPWNSFRGTLLFKKDTIYNKASKDFDKQYVVINTLDFYDYLEGIVETNDTEHIEKNKVMAMIAKNYALFYMHPENRHQNIPKGAGYNAIDDPDLFQKYVWAGLEKTLHKRYQSLEETKNKLVVYNGYIPIMPYFNCSAGFTVSANEKWWRTDASYLDSRIDFARCDEFKGHGVGLAGQGAQRWAEKWWNWMEILNYYYDGVRVVNVDY